MINSRLGDAIAEKPVQLASLVHRYGIDAHAGRNTARLALAAELPASVLAELTGISVSTAERWSQWAKRGWTAYVGQRAADSREDIDSRKPAKQPNKHAN